MSSPGAMMTPVLPTPTPLYVIPWGYDDPYPCNSYTPTPMSYHKFLTYVGTGGGGGGGGEGGGAGDKSIMP